MSVLMSQRVQELDDAEHREIVQFVQQQVLHHDLSLRVLRPPTS